MEQQIKKQWLMILLSIFYVSQVYTYNKAALEYLKTHKKVRGPNPEDLDFSYANLAGINLSKANLRRANFRDANLTGANLSGADL